MSALPAWRTIVAGLWRSLGLPKGSRTRPWLILGGRLSHERAQAIPLVALVLPLLLAVIGLALDGGVVFDARRELQNVADTAAHAGASEIDLGHFRETGGLALDARAAVAVADQHVADYNALHPPRQQVTLEVASVVGRDRLVVRVSRVARPAFLRIVGVTSVRVTAEAAGTARSGGG